MQVHPPNFNNLRKYALLILLLAILIPAAFAAEGEEPFAFVALGDAGCGCDEQKAVAKRMIEWHREKPFQHVIMPGDNIYGEGFLRKKGGNPDLFVSRFDAVYKPLLDQGVIFHAVLGNHDLETGNGRYEIADKKRFSIQGDKGYYSFTPQTKESDLITFFGMNSTQFVDRIDDEQVQWLSRELAASRSKWKIVFFHHPIYTPPGKHEAEAGFLKAIENVLVAGGVKVTFAGHNHFYARLKPQKGIIHFVSGGGGRIIKTPRRSEFTQVIARSYHYMYLEVYSDRILFWAIPTEGSPLDQGAILLLFNRG